MPALGLNERQSAHLDMIRGLAAMAVLTGHVRGLFFIDYSSVAAKTPLLGFLYAVTGLGHQAVMIFFVLSGFFIGGSVLSTLFRWNWKRYLINRFVRLYLVLLPALAATAVLDYVAYRARAGPVYFDHAIRHFSTTPLAGHHQLSVFLGNAVFLQTILVPTFGSNSPLWSLAYEFWYYMLFPTLVIAVFGKRSLRNRFCAAVVALAIVAWLPRDILLGFLSWLLGVAVYQAPKIALSTLVRRVYLLLSVVAFAAVLVLSDARTLPADWTDLTVALGFAMCLYSIVRIESARTTIFSTYQSAAKLVSGCSYSVYALHFPVVMLIRCSVGTSVWQPSAANLVTWTAVAGGVFLAGFLFSRLTEAHTENVRKKLLAVGFKNVASYAAARY